MDKLKSKIDWKGLFQKMHVTKPIYVALSGSHLYGFNSPDSDIDLRGCHCEPLYEVLGLHGNKDTREGTDGEIDFVSFDIRKELGLVMANNSNVLEHLAATPVYKSNYFYEELKDVAEKSLSKLVAKPYMGMAVANQNKYLRTFNEAYREATAKKYLYVIRGYMAGIYALENKRIQPNLKKLNEMRRFKIPIVDELIELKMKKAEFVDVTQEIRMEADKAIDYLAKEFAHAEANTTLPSSPQNYDKANELLIKIRMKGEI